MNLTSLSDIAGRVARETGGAESVTVGGVCLPTGALKHIRKSIPTNHPKWRDAEDRDIEPILRLLLRESLSVVATTIRKSAPVWDTFWADAERTNAKTAPLSGRTMSFVKAATLIKFALFGDSASKTTAHGIKIGTVPRINPKRFLHIKESLVFDNEIQGKDNVEAFMDIWDQRNKSQPLTALMKIRWEIVDVKLSTEQEEPLLLLADYAAGIAHAVHSTTDVLSAGKISREAATAAHATLISSVKYADFVEDFDLQYLNIFPQFSTFARGAA